MPRDHIREFYQKGGYIKPPSKTRTDEALKRVRFAGGGKTAEQAVKALNRFKDLPSQWINDWKWRPLGDVAKEIGLDKIPGHVEDFGRFMKRMAGVAGSEGLSPEDMLKAYNITRFSMGRAAQFPETLAARGVDFVPMDQGKIRPEGAIASWFNTPTGERYLKQGAQGITDEAAVAKARDLFGGWGKIENLDDQLRWGPANLPGREGRASELIWRAGQGESDPSEWKDFMTGMRGIQAAKKGFMSSLLGRGDLPTLDARQIQLHTGLPTDASKRFSKPYKMDEGVDRLLRRQEALNYGLDPELEPFRQHLTHHAIWDKTAGETTTHQDIIDSMLNRAEGGRVGYAGGGKTLEKIPKAVEAAKSLYSGSLFEKWAQDTGRTAEELIEALRNKDAKVKKYGDTQTMRGVSDRMDPSLYAGTRVDMQDAPPVPRSIVNPEQLQGGYLVGGMSDLSSAGPTIRAINDIAMRKPIWMPGGSDFPIYNPDLWAGDPGALQGLIGTKLSEAGYKPGKGDVYFANKLMLPQALDQTHMAMDAATSMLRGVNLDAKAAAKFDDAVRRFKISVNPSKADPRKTVEAMPDFPGINSENLDEYLANTPMARRSALLKVMDKKAMHDLGVPGAASIRAAMTDPRLVGAGQGTTGRTVGRINMDEPIIADPLQPHGSYSANLGGEYLGGFGKKVPGQLLFKDWIKGKGFNPRTMDSNDVRSMIISPTVQKIDQRFLDWFMPRYEKLPDWQRGGRVGYAGGGKTLEKIPKYIERAMASPLFQEWFGKSKLVDEAGRPTPVFHASPFSFDAFREPASHQELGIHVGDAPTAYERSKTMMPGGEPQTYPLFARAVNPLRLPDLGTWYPQDMQRGVREIYEGVPDWQDRDAALRWLRGKGHDSVVYKNEAEVPGLDPLRTRWNIAKARAQKYGAPDGSLLDVHGSEEAFYRQMRQGGTDSYMLFSPKQLKSALNPGSWSPWDPGLMKADGGPVPAITSSSIEGLVKLIKKASGIAQSRRFQDAADVTNLKPYSEQALLDTFSRPESVYGAMQPSHFERYAYPLKLENNLLQPHEMPGATKPAYVAGSASPDMGFTTREQYLDHLRGIAEGTGFTSVPELHVGYRGRGETPIITTHDGRHRMRTLRGMGDEPTLVEFKPELLHYKGVTVPRLPTMLKRGQILPQNNISRFDTVDLPDELFAFGGRV